MKKFKLFKIKSITDVITNSSTEVFIVKNDDAFKELQKTLKYVEFDILDTEEKLKEFIIDLWIEQDLDFLDRYNILVDNPLKYIATYSLLHEDTLHKTKDEVWEFFKKAYFPLLDYAIAMEEDDCGGEMFHMELDECAKLANKEGIFNTRI